MSDIETIATLEAIVGGDVEAVHIALPPEAEDDDSAREEAVSRFEQYLLWCLAMEAKSYVFSDDRFELHADEVPHPVTLRIPMFLDGSCEIRSSVDAPGALDEDEFDRRVLFAEAQLLRFLQA